MPINAHSGKIAAAAAALLWSASAQAATDATGIWFDHNGRGAVEIKPCASGSGLCGHVVNIKDPANASRCGLQILGEVTSAGGGWIYSPERKRKYDVELTRLSDDKLRVVGNAGSRFFSRTFTWNRAPDDIARCGETTAAVAPAKDATTEAKPAVTSTAPVAVPVTTGAASGAAALVANTSAKTTGAVSPTAKEATAASTIAPAPAATAKPAATTTKTAAAPSDGAGTTETSSDTGSKRKCKYKIPYIGRTVSVPCRD
jgi:uncharacterized protein (DUF2147 family)